MPLEVFDVTFVGAAVCCGGAVVATGVDGVETLGTAEVVWGVAVCVAVA